MYCVSFIHSEIDAHQISLDGTVYQLIKLLYSESD